MFVLLDANRPWRKAKVTERRTAQDFAVCMRDLGDVHYPRPSASGSCSTICRTIPPARCIRPSRPDETRRILRQLEFHFVLKHASWLNMVEIEIGVLASQCLDRRIERYRRLVAEVAAWQKRNAARARVTWSFTAEQACAKMGCAYPRLVSLKRPARRRPQVVKTSVPRY